VLPLLDPETAENVPARQGVHADAANDEEKNPGLQGVHALDVPVPTVEKLPGRHDPDQLDAPAKQKNPGGQGKQKELPKKWTNVPGKHFEHNELVPLPKIEKLAGPHSPLPLDELQPARQYAPAGQGLHAAVVPLPATEKLPAPQTPLPSELPHPSRQNLPPGQAAQDELVPLPATEKLPAPHNPLPPEELHPAKQYAPAGHNRHALADVDPFISLYLPAAHTEQDALVPLPTVE
jgi:hypothetical protein